MNNLNKIAEMCEEMKTLEKEYAKGIARLEEVLHDKPLKNLPLSPEIFNLCFDIREQLLRGKHAKRSR